MSPAELISFADTFMWVGDDTSEQLPTNPDGETIGPHGATPWEMIDLAHADHEGRHVIEGTPDCGGCVPPVRRQPVFDREPFEQAIEAVRRADAECDGHVALESGLCDAHSRSTIDRTTGTHVDEDRPVESVMTDCPDCRTPGEWVGQQLDQMRVDTIQEMTHDA